MDPHALLRVAVAVLAAAGSFDSSAALATPPTARSCPDCHGPVQNRRVVITGDAFTEMRFDAAMTRFATALQDRAEMRRVQAWATVPAGDGAADLAEPPAPVRSREPQSADTGAGNAALAPGWPFALLLAIAWLVRRRA